MKQTCLINTKENEKGIAGQAHNDRSFLMKKIGVKIFIVFALFVTTSCNKSPEKTEKDCLTNAVNQIMVDNQYQWIVVLPGLGCHGCIQEGELFMQNHITNRQILFILTRISSLKILQQKINIQISEHPNIYVDKKNIFAIPTDNSIYPCVIQLKNRKILNHSFQSPQNAALHQLEKLIENE
jgi:hypothetical protein